MNKDWLCCKDCKKSVRKWCRRHSIEKHSRICVLMQKGERKKAMKLIYGGS